MSQRKSSKTRETKVTLPFEKFWSWLQSHPGCILRVGTPEAVLFDHETFHWGFLHEPTQAEDSWVVQLFLGKTLVGEIILVPSDISYVEVLATGEGEYSFDCISETPTDRVAVIYFVLSHGFEDDPPVPSTRLVH